MSVEKFFEQRQIQICVTLVKDFPQAVLHDREFIAFKIQGHESSLLRVGKAVQFGKILMYGMNQKLFYIASVQAVFVKVGPQIRKSRLLFQIGNHLGNRVHLGNLLILAFPDEFTLHGTDFRGQTAV